MNQSLRPALANLGYSPAQVDDILRYVLGSLKLDSDEINWRSLEARGFTVEEPEKINLGNLHWAAGLGLRLHTIVGPVRADFGYRLNRTGGMNPDPDSTWAFHFSLGEAF